MGFIVLLGAFLAAGNTSDCWPTRSSGMEHRRESGVAGAVHGAHAVLSHSTEYKKDRQRTSCTATIRLIGPPLGLGAAGNVQGGFAHSFSKGSAKGYKYEFAQGKRRPLRHLDVLIDMRELKRWRE